MKKSKITMIVMFACVALFIALFIVFFVLGDGFKSEYSTLGALIAGGGTDEEVAQWTARRNELNGLYTFASFTSYLTSILALASVGVGLFLSDKFREAEEKAAEMGQ